MHKLLPFRQYDEKDVINLFKLDLSIGGGATLASMKPGVDHYNKAHWSGSLVGVSATTNDFVADDPSLNQAQGYLGAIGAGNQGFALQKGSAYPEAPMTVQPGVATVAANGVLGMTLRATLAYDENDEKLLYYNEKLDELQCVLPGQAVPIVDKGFFTLTSDSGLATGDQVGHPLKAAANGLFDSAAGAAGTAGLGFLLAKGDRSGNATNDTFFISFNANGSQL